MKESEAREVLPGSGDLLEIIKDVCAEAGYCEVNEFDEELGRAILYRIVNWMVGEDA